MELNVNQILEDAKKVERMHKRLDSLEEIARELRELVKQMSAIVAEKNSKREAYESE